ANDDCSSYANECAITQRSQARCGRNSAAIELRAVLRHWMAANGKAGPVKICYQAFFVVHRIEGRKKGSRIGIAVPDMLLEESTGGAARALHLPKCAAAVNASLLGNKIQRSYTGENAQLIFLNLRDALL